MAGIDTIAQTSTNTISSFSKDSVLMERVHDIVKPLTYQDYETHSEFDNIVSEALRLNSAAITTSQRAFIKNCKVAGFKFKKGDTITFPCSAKHFTDVYFKDPIKFDENRFKKDTKNPGAAQDKINYSPFGLGKRICIGQYFAKLAIKSILNHFFTKFEIKEDKDRVLPWRMAFVYGI